MTAYAVRGLDINTSYTIYHLLNEQKKKGVAIIYVGEDLDVLIDLCDRDARALLAANNNGIVDGRKTNKEEIGLMMTKSVSRRKKEASPDAKQNTCMSRLVRIVKRGDNAPCSRRCSFASPPSRSPWWRMRCSSIFVTGLNPLGRLPGDDSAARSARPMRFSWAHARPCLSAAVSASRLAPAFKMRFLEHRARRDRF